MFFLIIACNITSGMMKFSSKCISIAFTHYRNESQAVRNLDDDDMIIYMILMIYIMFIVPQVCAMR